MALSASTSIYLRLLRLIFRSLGGGGVGGYGISMGLEYFQKFLDKPMQRESDFGGCLISFFENFIFPLRLSLLRLESYKS